MPTPFPSRTMTPARRALLDSLWQRFCGEMVAAGLGDHFARAATDPEVRRNEMKYFIRRGVPPGWEFRSVIEAAELELAHRFQPRPAAEPCRALPGSREKLGVLAARIEAGEDPWHAEDEDGEEATA